MAFTHRKDAKDAEEYFFVCPENFSGQTKRLFWRIGISRFSRNNSPLCDLRVSNESLK
jgi:hypothetical protein